MVDEESKDAESQPAEGASESAGGAPLNRDKRSDPGVIEGEVSRLGEPAPPAHEEGGPAPPAAGEPPPPTRGRRRGGGFFAGLLGGLIVSGAAAGVGYYFYAPAFDLAEANASRLPAIEAHTQRIESRAQRQDSAIAGLDKRVGALEGASPDAAIAAVEKRVAALQAAIDPIDKRLGQLQMANDGIDKRVAALQAANDAVDKRLGALQSGKPGEPPRTAAETQSVQTLTGEMKDLRSNVDAARAQIPSLQARVAKLESAPQAAAVDLSSVTARLDKIDAQLAATRNETQASLERAAASDNPAAVAILTDSLRGMLDRGQPFPTELAALERLGVDPAKLAPLKAVVNGASTDSALAADFQSVRSKVLAAAAPPNASTTEPGTPPKTEGEAGYSALLDRVVSHLSNLVQVRKLNEAAGKGPQALASQIETDSQHGDVSGALAAYAELPEPSREAASAWASAAEKKLAAEEAVQSIREAAVAQLAKSVQP